MPSSWLLIVTLLPLPAGPVRVERTVYAMGTELRITVEASDRTVALRAGEQALRAVEATEARLSTWRPSTELAQLNRAAAGEVVRLSPALASELEKARWCRRVTAGAFDPAIGSLVRAWGLREGGRRPSPDELEAALAASGLDALSFADAGAVRGRDGVAVEEGGFGKGAGLAAALIALAADPRVRRAALDFGGQVALYGTDASWRMTLADPGDRQRPVLALVADHGSIATSGNSERGFEIDGQRRGHLLDPRTGLPAPDFGSLTVLARDPFEADCLSTGLYVMGPEPALEWAAVRPGIEVLVLERREGSIRARATVGLRGRIEPLIDGIEVEWYDERLALQEGSMASP